MTPQELYRVEKEKAEARKMRLFAELRAANDMLISPKRARPKRTEEFKAHRREIQQEYRRRLRPIDVRV